MQAISEPVEIPAMTDMQKLAFLKREIALLDVDISAAEEACGVTKMKHLRSEKQQEFSDLLADTSARVEYSEDKFLKALKRKGDSYREGAMKIVRSSRTTRAVLTEKFAAAFPDLLPKVCKIELTKADALVGKATMDAFVEKKTTYSYEFVDMSEAA